MGKKEFVHIKQDKRMEKKVCGMEETREGEHPPALLSGR